MIREKRAIEAEEALRWVTILLVANPEIDREYREQWLGYWTRLANGEDVDMPGPQQITSGSQLIGWLAQQGYSRTELGGDPEQAAPAPEPPAPSEG